MSKGGDQFSRVSGGDPLKVSARWYNAVTQAAQAMLQGGWRPGLGAGDPIDAQRSSTMIKIVNTTNADIKQFGILQVYAPAILPAKSEVQFASLFTFDGIAPTTTGVFAIAQEPIRKDGGVGRAVIAGISKAFLTIVDADHGYAGPTTSTEQLTTATGGPCRIVWKESATGTGVRAAVLIMGAPTNRTQRVLTCASIRASGS